jgi:ElaB/YqjD/DUF883 family membrane-anchored ribosome-binding protein
MANDAGMTDTAKRVEDRIDTARDSFGARVKEKAGEVADTVKARAATVRDKIRQTDWDDVMSNVTSYVKDNPGKAVGIALGVGFALGVLLRRRGDD